MLRIFVFLQVFFIGLFADGVSTLNEQLKTINEDLLKNSDSAGNGGSFFNLVTYGIIFIGIIFMAVGINETFIAPDRPGENKKMNGVLKIIGGACMVAIFAFYKAVN